MPTLVLLSIALFGYAGLRLVPALTDHPLMAALVGLLLLVCAVGIPAMAALLSGRRRSLRGARSGSPPAAGRSTTGPSAGRVAPGVAAVGGVDDEPDHRRLMAAGFVLVGFASSILVLTLLRDIGLALVQLADWLLPSAAAFNGWPGTTANLARLREVSALAVPLLAMAASAVGWYGARRTAPVKTVEVPIAGLPPGLDGFTIAQISDIHVGNTIGAPFVEAIVERVNALDADLVAITGDLVDGTVAELAQGVAPLAGLRSRHGSFFVTGNHEYYSGVGPWLTELSRLGIEVLLNRHVVIDRAGAKLVLGGVTDFNADHFVPAHRSDAAAAMAGAPADAGARVLLAHQPRSAQAAAAAGFDLQLSGHTHGGQFLPWKYFVRFQQPFTAGLDRLGRMWIYTSRGTGYWGPPMRLGAPSEITRVRLRCAPPGTGPSPA